MYLYSRLIGSVFAMFAREKLGYDVTLVTDTENINSDAPVDTDQDSIFRRLSSCRNEL